MAKKSSGPRRTKPATKRHFPRTARLNSLLTEIVADHFERADDDRLGFMTVTGVEVDSDLNVAQVFVSTLGTSVGDDEMLEALAEYRKPLQRAIATEAKLRKTPEVRFEFDPGVRHGARVEEILATLDLGDDEADEDDDAVADGVVEPDEAD